MKRFWFLIAAASTANVAPALAQGGPDTLVNVQVLSKDLSRREVMNFMRGVERYYGSWSYDFSEPSLNGMAQQLARRDDWDGALTILNLNKEFFPESTAIYTGIGQAYMEKGDDDLALQHLERALELNPENRMARRLLRELR